MYEFIQVLKLDLKNLFKNKAWFVFVLPIPIMLTAILGFMMENSFGGLLTSYSYYTIAILMFTATNSVSFVSNAFLEERIKQANMRLVTTPISYATIYISKVVAVTMYVMFYSIIVFVANSFIFSADVLTNIVPQLVIYTLSSLSFGSVTMLICCLLRSEEIVSTITGNLQTILCALGGIFFPIYSFGEMMHTISKFSPITYLMNTLISMVFDHSLQTFIPVTITMVFVIVVCLGLCKKVFKAEAFL